MIFKHMRKKWIEADIQTKFFITAVSLILLAAVLFIYITTHGKSDESYAIKKTRLENKILLMELNLEVMKNDFTDSALENKANFLKMNSQFVILKNDLVKELHKINDDNIEKFTSTIDTIEVVVNEKLTEKYEKLKKILKEKV